jgi:predicted XRE-type DNA-binding protein
MAKLLENKPARANAANTAEGFKELIVSLCPKAEVRMEAGGEKAGNAWLRIKDNEVCVTVEWRPGSGVGIYHPGAHAYGESPQEVFSDLPIAARRVQQLLKAQALNQPGLRTLRKLFNFSQKELAGRLRIEQAAVSRMEGRKDVKLQSLVNAVRAMGGEVEIRVHFNGGELPILMSKHNKSDRSAKKLRRPVHA